MGDASNLTLLKDLNDNNISMPNNSISVSVDKSLLDCMLICKSGLYEETLINYISEVKRILKNNGIAFFISVFFNSPKRCFK